MLGAAARTGSVRVSCCQLLISIGSFQSRPLHRQGHLHASPSSRWHDAQKSKSSQTRHFQRAPKKGSAPHLGHIPTSLMLHLDIAPSYSTTVPVAGDARVTLFDFIRVLFLVLVFIRV